MLALIACLPALYWHWISIAANQRNAGGYGMTELVWDGKYDKDGRRVAPVRIALPFQTVETVNESGVQRANQLGYWV
jgi:hypothetical protein